MISPVVASGPWVGPLAPIAIRLPSGDHATAFHGAGAPFVAAPLTVRTCVPLVASHTSTVPSLLAQAMRVSSRDHATDTTPSAYPSYQSICLPSPAPPTAPPRLPCPGVYTGVHRATTPHR